MRKKWKRERDCSIEKAEALLAEMEAASLEQRLADPRLSANDLRAIRAGDGLAEVVELQAVEGPSPIGA